MSALASQPVRVLVSGLGPVTCLGFGMDDLVEGMADFTVMQDTELKAERVRARFGIVRDFDLSEFIDTRRPYLDPQSRCALASAALALESAGVEADEVDPLRCGLSFATVLGNLETQMLFQRQVDEKGMRLGSPVLFSHAYANSTNSILSIEFSLRGYNQNFCGDLLCGAQALEAAALAIRAGKAELMVAGGADVTGPELLDRLRRSASPDAPQPGQGAALLVLEGQDSVERREGYAFCEVGAIICRGIRGQRSVDRMAEAARAVVREAMDEAHVWEGDIGAVFLCVGGAFPAEAREVGKKALQAFSQVPVTTVKHFVGETFAAGFPLECALAADVLNNGYVPPKVTLQGRRRGVEFLVEQQPEPMLGHSALVVGCTPDLAAAAILRAL